MSVLPIDLKVTPGNILARPYLKNVDLRLGVSIDTENDLLYPKRP
jgi:hypothetical protein